MCKLRNTEFEEEFIQLNIKFNKIVVFDENIEEDVITQEDKDFYEICTKEVQKSLKKPKKKSKKKKDEDNEDSDEDNMAILDDDLSEEMGPEEFEKIFESIDESSDEYNAVEKVAQAKIFNKNFLIEYDTKRLVVQEFDYDSYFDLGMTQLKIPSILQYLKTKKNSKDDEIDEDEESDPDFHLELDAEIEKIKASLIFRNFELQKKKKKEGKKGKKDEKPKNPFDIDLVSFDQLRVDQIYTSKSYYNHYHNNSYRFKDLLDPNTILVNNEEEENNIIINPEFQLKTHNYITSYLTQYNFKIVQDIDIRFFHDLYLQCFPFTSNIYYNSEMDRVFLEYDPLNCMDYRHQGIIPNSVLLNPKNYKNIELDMYQEILNMNSKNNDDNFEEELLVELLNEHSDEEHE